MPTERDRAARRRRQSAAYRRWRFAIAAVCAIVALGAGIVVGRNVDGGHPPSPRQATRQQVKHQREEQPVHFTVSASGDLLIHSPVWERALALGGGGHYDFAPEFAQIKPYVSGASLAL